MRAARRARRRRRRRRARVPARLEPLARSTSGRTSSPRFAAVTDLPLWVSEVGVSTFGAEEVQEFGLQRTAELLRGRVDRDPLVQPVRPAAGVAGDDAASRGRGVVVLPPLLHGPAAGGRTPKLALRHFSRATRRRSGICQWFHFEDHRLDDAVRWLRDLGVKHLRTGLSWADSLRPDARRVVRPPDAGAGAVRRDCHILLHA